MKEIIVQSQDPIRLDRYLRRYYPDATQGVIEKSLRTGAIKLNNSKAKTNMRVVAGDLITIADSVFASSDATNIEQLSKGFSANVVSLASKLLYDYRLFTSEQFIAINKPAGLAVQGGSKISLSIDDAIAQINHTTDTNYKLVHRLDKETSGVLLLANGFENAARLARAFQDGLIKKIYIAVLENCPDQPEGTIENNIGKDRSGIFEVVKKLDNGGKLAKTQYKVLQHKNKMSLVEFAPLTGRMHQLRFHAQFLGCPIVGDTKYGGKKHARMLLHAKKLTIHASIFGKEITINSEPSWEFDLD